MTEKSITENVERSMTAWLSSIKNESLRKKVKKNLIVTGGSLTSMFLDEKINDYDVYIKDRKVLGELIKYYIQPKFGCQMSLLDYDEIESKKEPNKKEGLDLLDQLHIKKSEYDAEGPNPNSGLSIAISNLQKGQFKLFDENGSQKIDVLDIISRHEDNIVLEGVYEPVFYSANAITLTNKIQLIIRFWGDPKEIHKNFDFVHVTNYFTFDDGLVVKKKALKSLLTKELRYRGSLYPVTSMIRTRKFIERGFTINAGEYFKIAYQISKLDLDDPYVLEEQLMGVDVAYFNMLIESLRKAIKENKDFKVTTDWLFMKIDEFFG